MWQNVTCSQIVIFATIRENHKFWQALVTAKRTFFNVEPGYTANLQINVAYVRYDPLFFFFLFFILRRMGKNKAEAPTLPRIRYMSCFDLTHAPAATASRAAATGLVSMSTRPDIPGMLHLEREARDWSTYNEHSYRMLLLLYVYCSRAHPHFPSQFRRRRPKDIFLPVAQTHQNPGGKAI